MDYKKRHDAIIESARKRGNKKSPGMERHHIIPRSVGGDNSPYNLVYLTTREHFLIHKLLIKIYESENDNVAKKKMIYALWWMCKTRRKLTKISSRDYEYARRLFSENNPNKCQERKRKFKEKRKRGEYKYDDKKSGRALSKALKNLPKEEMDKRMSNSLWNCDHVKRGESISKGKSSKYRLYKKTGEIIDFWSYDNILDITGYNRQQINYKIRNSNGLLASGDKVEYLQRYTGNDINIGRVRKNKCQK